MSVIMEFTVDAEEFQLGETLAGVGDSTYELERIIPTDSTVHPYVWITTDGNLDGLLKSFEKKLADSPHVRDVVHIDRVANGALYRITWGSSQEDLIDAFTKTNASVLEGRSERGARWTFRVRFSDHEQLSVFNNHLIEHDVKIHIDRIYTFSEETDRRRQFGLSDEQREAVVLALRRGYFATPKATSLDELADELGVSKQAVSNRIRRGTETVLETTMLSSAISGTRHDGDRQ